MLPLHTCNNRALNYIPPHSLPIFTKTYTCTIPLNTNPHSGKSRVYPAPTHLGSNTRPPRAGLSSLSRYIHHSYSSSSSSPSPEHRSTSSMVLCIDRASKSIPGKAIMSETVGKSAQVSLSNTHLGSPPRCIAPHTTQLYPASHSDHTHFPRSRP